MLVDGLKQADAGIAEKGAELGIDFQFATQAMQDGIHDFVMFNVI